MIQVDRRAFLFGSLAFCTSFPAASGWARGLTGIPAPDIEAMVPVSGGRIYVRVNGKLDSGQKPLILIHGGPGSVGIDFFQFLALAPDRPVIIYDQLDSGRSDRPGDPSNWKVPRFVDELDAIRGHFSIPSWHVYGGSWGGTIALEYGARRSPALASLILQSPLVSTRSWVADADVLRRDLPPDIQQVLLGCDPPRPVTPACEAATDVFYDHYLAREPRSEALLTYRKAHPKDGFNGTIYNAMWGSSEFVATGTLRDYDGEPLLDRLDGKRTLFVTGQYDEARSVTVGAFARRAKAEFAVIPGAGHAILNDRPEELLGILRPWLREHDA